MKLKLKIFMVICLIPLITAGPINAIVIKNNHHKSVEQKRLEKRKYVIKIAKRYLGVPYVWGGFSPRGFDCSGLIRYVYAKINIFLPHNAQLQYNYGKYVNIKNLIPGDLVFFNHLGHVGMYIGDGKFIHSPHTGSYVKISPMRYESSYYGAKRII